MLGDAGDYTTQRPPLPATGLAALWGTGRPGVACGQAKTGRCTACLHQVTGKSACSSVDRNREGVVGAASDGRMAVVLPLGVDSLAFVQAPAAGTQAGLTAGTSAGTTVRTKLNPGQESGKQHFWMRGKNWKRYSIRYRSRISFRNSARGRLQSQTRITPLPQEVPRTCNRRSTAR